MPVQMKLCQSKQADLLFSASLHVNKFNFEMKNVVLPKNEKFLILSKHSLLVNRHIQLGFQISNRSI